MDFMGKWGTIKMKIRFIKKKIIENGKISTEFRD